MGKEEQGTICLLDNLIENWRGSIMEHENMKRISLAEVQSLPNGTKVYVECVGNEWCLDESAMKSWNIKQDDGLHYEVEDEDHTISFPYDHDYDGTNMSIICYIGEYGCDCCLGNKAVHYKDNEISVFVDTKGEMTVTTKDELVRFKVSCCPNCGKKFD